MTTKTRGRVRVEDAQKRVRVYLGGDLIADTRNAKLVWEKPYYPTYYFPSSDVDTESLVDTGETYRSPSRGEAGVYTVKGGGKEAAAAARWYRDVEIDDIADHVSLNWSQMDAWFEEDEQVYVHARDPYTRIDVLQSSRHVEIFIDGTKVADSDKPLMLFETGLPARYYIPKTDVRLDLLEQSDHETRCPYKGTANYYHVDVGDNRHENIVWWYKHPIHESARIAGYVCFYDEKVDVKVDGELQEQPKTVFS